MRTQTFTYFNKFTQVSVVFELGASKDLFSELMLVTEIWHGTAATYHPHSFRAWQTFSEETLKPNALKWCFVSEGFSWSRLK